MKNNGYRKEYCQGSEGNISEHSEIKYERLYDDVWIREQPFYKAGMSRKEAMEELNYLNNNLDSFYNGSYLPLWKQSIYNMWFR